MLSDFLIRLRALFRRDAVENELNDELRFHFDQQVEKYIQSGLPAPEAHRRARLIFGGTEQIKEECRDARGVNVVESLFQDVHYGARMLSKSPGFTFTAVLTIALGVGANTSIFSLVNAVMLSSIPVRDPGNLVVLQWSANSSPQGGYSTYGDCRLGQGSGRQSGCSLSYPMFKEIRSHADVFSGVAAFAGPAQLDLSGNDQASIARGELVSGDFFQTLGIGAAAGRVLNASDELPGAEPVAVLSYSCWQKMFAGSPAAIGKIVRLNNVSFRIVGVADPGFTRLSPGKTQDMWLPLTFFQQLRVRWGGDIQNPANWWLTVVARVNPGTNVAQAQAATSVVFRNAVVHGDVSLLKESDDPVITLLPAQNGLVGIRTDLGTPLYILMAAVGIVLFIACANVAGLMLARSTTREREMAVRAALGAGRGRIIRQLLTESVLLSVAGGSLGILCAYWGAYSLAAFVSHNQPSPAILDVTPDVRVLAFTAATAVLTGILFGLAPAFRAVRVNVAPALKDGAGNLSRTGNARTRRFGLGSSLVIVQVGLSVVVLIAAGLLARTLANLKNIDPGFDTQNILHFGIDPTLTGYENDKMQSLYKEFQTRLAALPGVISTSYASEILLNGGLSSTSVHIDGEPDKSSAKTNMLAVGPDFFETMRIPLLNGRTFAPIDSRAVSDVAIINQTFVHRYLNGRNPIGLHLEGGGDEHIRREIVGVVADAKYDRLRTSVEPTAYVPLKEGAAYFELRTGPRPETLIPAVRKIANDVDNNLPLFDLGTQTETVDRLLFNERIVARLSSLFGVVALLLACVGLYGLLSYEVARGTREIGIRTALGAQPRDVFRLVLRQGLVLVFCGAVAGMAVATGVTRYLQSLLYGVRASDPLTFASIVLLLVFVALFACYIPSRRATRVDPMVALRHE